MIYTIATLRSMDGKLEVTINKDGNYYYVGLRNSDLDEFTYKNFIKKEDAKKAFYKISDMIIDSLYSYDQKKQVLLDD